MSIQAIRQNSTDKISIGPAVDLDGFTLNTALLISTADSASVKLGDDSVVDISGYTWAATTNMDGEFDLTLQSGISDTIGPLTVLIEDVSLILPIREKFYVYDPVVYDTMFADSPTILVAEDVGEIYKSTIGTATSDSDFLMDTAIVSDDSWIGAACLVIDATNGDKWPSWIVDIQQATDRVIVEASPRGITIPFTVVAGDTVIIYQDQHPRYTIDEFDPPTRTELTTDTNAILLRMLAFAQLEMRKDAAIKADRVSQLAELNADEGSGGGVYDNITDSQQATQDDVGPIKTKTDQLAFTVGGEVDSNAKSMNDTELIGKGIQSDLFRGNPPP